MSARSFQKGLTLIGALLVLLAIPTLAGAQPASNPPGGNVDATFNNVTVTDGTVQVGVDSAFPSVYGELSHAGGGTGFQINAEAGGGTWADILFQTNGITRMFLESNGNFGVGTVTPAYKLHVADRMKLDGTNAGLWLEAGSSDWFIGRSGSGGSNLRFYRGGDQLTIDTAGDVGIGTTNPIGDLDVASGSNYVRLYKSGNIYTSGGGVTSGTNVTAYNGYVRAGSIGRFYTNDGISYNPRNDNHFCHYSSTWGSTPNDYCAMYASCSSGDVIVGMMTGYTAGMGAAGGWQYVASGFHDADTGYIVFYSPDDNNSAPTTVYPRAVCFSPNG